ncbi:MAG: PadR family transcriptional regulator [Kiloniellaceae bacterium]
MQDRLSRRWNRGRPHRGHGGPSDRPGDGPQGRHHRHGGRGRRTGRIFDHGELRLVVLALIAEHPRHGYDIIKAIEDRLAGSYSPSPGVIYPTLTLLEEIGHATVAESAGKKLYAITEAGRAFLAGQQPAVDAVLARLSAGNEGRGGRAPQIVRAMENLKTALRLRQRQGPLSEDELQRIAEILDGAALAIERS